MAAQDWSGPGPDPAVPRSRRAVAGTAVVFAVCGLMISVSAVNARGTDLRPDRQTDLIGLITEQSARNDELRSRVAATRAEVDQLAARSGEDPARGERLAALELAAAMTPVEGPAVTVTLTDAPRELKPPGVSDDALVVHQQDIQAVANALWSGGAEAMTIQGVRVISTTGIKCVGNTVVLHGRPYAPPYVITAIGDPERLRAALADSDAIRIYRQYVDAYQLGYAERTDGQVRMPGHEGSADLAYARQPR